MNQAVIDIGTNTLILLIAKPLKTNLQVLVDQPAITRLGQGLTENHCFDSKAMNRTVAELARFKTLCLKHKVKKIICVGTAACRTAANAEVFLDRLASELKFNVKVITGQQEAEYVFVSAWKDFGEKNKKLLVFDIGGGSTEIITGSPQKKKIIPDSAISIPFGTVNCTELHVHHDPIEAQEFNGLLAAIKNEIRDNLDDFYPEDFDPTQYQLVATAGTATTLLALAKQMKVFKRDKIHGAVLTMGDLDLLIPTLVRLDVQGRQKLPGMEPMRADVILAGAIIFKEILAFFKQDRAVISCNGLRYGVFWKHFMKA